MRFALSAVMAGALASLASAQTAQPPAAAALDRLGLRSEWVSAIPLDGERDAVLSIQVADDRQIFVQTRGGLLLAFDARTGERQWSFRYDVIDTHPFTVAWNDRYVFAFNITKMHGIQRLNGVMDFTQKLPLAPTSPPIADADTVYVVMAGNRIAAYDLPAGLAIPDPALVKAANKLDPTASTRKTGLQNPADVVAGRYPSPTRNINVGEDRFDQRTVRITAEPAGSFGSTQQTASLSVVASMRQPYRSFDESGRYLNNSPSLSTLPSLRQPYHLQDPTSRNVQRTPSIAVIPPSLVSLHESANLRPRGIELHMRWIYGSTVPIGNTPLLTRNRFWGFSKSPVVVALDKSDGKTEIDARLSADPTATAGQAEDVGYVPQEDGYLAAIDLSGGAATTVRTLWKSNVGGLMNAAPVPSGNAVYQAGAFAGIARVDRSTGEVVWRTERASDKLLALNDEHVYARDIHGRIYVFDRNRVSDAATKRAYPLATVDLPGFTEAVTNDKTDRIFLASRSGLFICLRDAAPKYAAPMNVAPPKSLPPPPKPGAAPKIEEKPKN